MLKTIAAGSGAIVAGKSLPESWSKPIVDAVVLPAHAETTDETITDPTTTVSPTTSTTTTTQGCCLIAETYCTSLGNQQGFIEISVTTEGNITVTVFADGQDVLTDTISCTGESFNASDSNHTVTGTVGCAATSISGQASIFGGDPINYTATPEDCARG